MSEPLSEPVYGVSVRKPICWTANRPGGPDGVGGSGGSPTWTSWVLGKDGEAVREDVPLPRLMVPPGSRVAVTSVFTDKTFEGAVDRFLATIVEVGAPRDMRFKRSAYGSENPGDFEYWVRRDGQEALISAYHFELRPLDLLELMVDDGPI